VASWRRDPERIDIGAAYFRQVERAYPPLWHPGPPSAPVLQPAGRWHVPGDLVQYLSSDTDGAWAELVRYEHIRTEGERLEERRRLYRCQISEHDIADLRNFDTALDLGLDPELLIEDDHARARALAGELRAAGYRGVLAPSAALSATVNLTLFGGRREVAHNDPELVSRGNPRPDFWVPVQPLVDEGSAPAELLDRVRLQGDLHLGFEQWKEVRVSQGLSALPDT
jgi:RES domain